MINVEIDEHSGFCFGVTTAIRKAEEELQRGAPLYCLGDIVHNGMECERLRSLGLIAINHDEFAQLRNVRVLLRAHGEPPETYEAAHRNGIDIIDATCPVVLNIQKRIKQEYDTPSEQPKQIIIYGQKGHAEVLGLVGQTDGTAIVIESIKEIDRIDFTRHIYLYSQTTKSLDEFRLIVETIKQRIAPNVEFRYYDTICRQVSNRLANIRAFAASHDLVFFVCVQEEQQRQGTVPGVPEGQPQLLPHRGQPRDRLRAHQRRPVDRHLRCHLHPQMADGRVQTRNYNSQFIIHNSQLSSWQEESIA